MRCRYQNLTSKLVIRHFIERVDSVNRSGGEKVFVVGGVCWRRRVSVYTKDAVIKCGWPARYNAMTRLSAKRENKKK
jgi:hypothetical protein